MNAAPRHGLKVQECNFLVLLHKPQTFSLTECKTFPLYRRCAAFSIFVANFSSGVSYKYISRRTGGKTLQKCTSRVLTC